MQATADSLAFAPPPEPAAGRGFALAVLAHLLLMGALTWGIAWNKDATPVAVEAELWSSIPQEAAPKPVAASPVMQAPPPPAPTVTAPPPPPPVVKEADISLEREKKKREQERLAEIEERKKLEAQKKKQQQLEAEREKRERAEQQAKLAKEKLEKEREKAREQERDKAKLAQDAKRREDERKKNIERMLASAAGSGSPDAAGTAARSKGPSATYAGRIAARIKPNIVFTDVVTGNPAAEVQIRVAPDGTIVGSTLVKKSGVPGWDDAVLRAITKTEKLPRDTDGTVVPEFTISFRPRD